MSDAVGQRPRFDGTINLGHLLTIGTLVLGFTGFLLDGRSGVTQAQRDVTELKQVVAQQSGSTREILKESLGRVEATVAAMAGQISILPTLTERQRILEETTKRLEERDTQLSKYLDDRRTQLDQRFQSLEQRAIESVADRRELRAAVDQVLRASQMSLPGSRGLR